MYNLDLVRQIWQDTCEFIGRHYYLAFVVLFFAVLLAFGVQQTLTVIGVLVAIAWIMYQLPDDDDFRGA